MDVIHRPVSDIMKVQKTAHIVKRIGAFDAYRTHSQMLGKIEYTLPAKF